VWNGYGMLGGRAYFLETLTVGSAGGAELGENREQSARFGGMVTLGGRAAPRTGSVTACSSEGAAPGRVTT